METVQQFIKKCIHTFIFGYKKTLIHIGMKIMIIYLDVPTINSQQNGTDEVLEYVVYESTTQTFLFFYSVFF